MDKWEVYPIKVLSMAPLVMVTLPMLSSLSSGGVVAGPRHPPPLVVTSLDSIDPSREWSLSSPTFLPSGQPLRWMTLSANGDTHTDFGLHHLHPQEIGSQTDAGIGQAGSPGPTDPSLLRPSSVAPSSTWVLLPFCTWTPLIASFWRHHPHVQDRGSSRMKSDLYTLVLGDVPL
jgi:hypothetical protein